MTHSTGSPSPIRWAHRAMWAALIAAIAGGMVLRLAFLLVSHLHVDEYSSIWAALQVLDKGIPMLPSGFFYLQGVLFTYLDALFITLLGPGELAVRLPSLLFSVFTIAAIYAWGQRAFGPWFGLMAASLTALAPDSIIWGGRARMYALQQALFVLAMYAFLRGYVEKGQKPGWRWTFAFLFVGALLSQTITVLAIPSLALSLLVWRRAWCTEKKISWPLVTLAFGALLAILLNHLGGPVSDTAERAFVAFSIPWHPKPEYFFREYLWSWPATLRTLLFIVGFVCLALPPIRRAITPHRPERSEDFLSTVQRKRQGCDQNDTAGSLGMMNVLYLYIIVGLTLLSMIFLVAESWQRPRYLVMLQPTIDLLAVGVLWYLYSKWGRLVANPVRSSTPVSTAHELRRNATFTTTLSVVTWLCTVAIFLPAAVGVIGPTEPAYDSAFRYIADRWENEDVVVGPLPSIPATYLGRCDGYMLQDGYGEYLIWQNGRPVDRWTGAPLIDSIESFERHFGQSKRVWFAVDSTRWQQRYTPEFREFIERNMSIVHQTFDVTVYQYSSTER